MESSNENLFDEINDDTWVNLANGNSINVELNMDDQSISSISAGEDEDVNLQVSVNPNAEKENTDNDEISEDTWERLADGKYNEIDELAENVWNKLQNDENDELSEDGWERLANGEDLFPFNRVDEGIPKAGRCYKVTKDNIDRIAQSLIIEAGSIPASVNSPLMILVRLRNPIYRKYRFIAFRFSPDSLEFIKETIRKPWTAWSNYNNCNPEADSDVAMILYNSKEDLRNPTANVWIATHIGLYLEDVPMSHDDQAKLKKLWEVMPKLFEEEKDGKRKNGRFMVYKLVKETLDANDSVYERWLKDPTNQATLGKKFQIPWFEDWHVLQEPNQGEGFIQDEIFSVPCFLFAIKNQIEPERYKAIKNSGLIHGSGVKTSVFTQLYKKFNIKIRLTNIYYEQNAPIVKETSLKQFHVQSAIMPKLTAKTRKAIEAYHSEIEKQYDPSNPKSPKFWEERVVNIQFWENHYMNAEDANMIKLEDGRSIYFIRLLEILKQKGILVKMNAYEYARQFENYSFDRMLNFDDKAFIRKTEDGYVFQEDNYDTLEYKPKKGIDLIYFADFESDTSGKFHVPYLLAAQGYGVSGNTLSKAGPELTFWGKNCAKNFLEFLATHLGYENKDKYSSKRYIRIYFHNLRYDFSFLLEHLYDVEQIKKGNTLYSVKGTYRSDITYKKIRIDFWDSYPIFQCKLKDAANQYLTLEQKKSIKKEVFPYELYTYEIFDRWSNGLLPIDMFLQSFKTDQEREDFRILFKENYDRFATLDENGAIFVNYIEYAKFYCLQDVRCLANIMINFATLLKGEGLQGINGSVPFSISLWKYRTVSSMSYDYFQQCVLFQKDENGNFIPRHNFLVPKCELRALIQKSIRGGRVMTRGNKTHFFMTKDPEYYLQDFDFVSLYPTAMASLWITDGPAEFFKREFNSVTFKKLFVRPEYDDEEYKKPFKDGICHVLWIDTKIDLEFPCICVKDPKTKLNNYQNFKRNQLLDTWINAIDLYNLIDFQDADFFIDCAIVWRGDRHTEIRDCIQNLFNFRRDNKKHAIQLVAKVMLNSIYGKSILKPQEREKHIIDRFRWRKTDKGVWKKVDNWKEYYSTNAYRINRMEPLGNNKIEFELFRRDVSASLNIFGSNCLAMARRYICRVTALAEELERAEPEAGPGIFYTDTDSIHITKHLLEKLKVAFRTKYGRELEGNEMGQCHEDFDIPKNFKKSEKVLGADLSYFIMKKVYCDRLKGDQQSEGFHKRMKGIPTNIIGFDDYKKLYEGGSIDYDLLLAKVSFFYEQGKVGSRREFRREVMTRETREKRKHEEKMKKQLTKINKRLKIK